MSATVSRKVCTGIERSGTHSQGVLINSIREATKQFENNNLQAIINVESVKEIWKLYQLYKTISRKKHDEVKAITSKIFLKIVFLKH